MRNLKLRLILSLPSIVYMVWYIWLFVTALIPPLETSISSIGNLTIGQIALLILGLTIGPATFIVALIWFFMVWTID